MTSKFQVSMRKSAPDPAAVAAFVSGVPEEGRAETAVATDSSLPWVGKDTRKRIPAFSLRLTEEEQVKLKYISEETPDSMHAFVLKAMQEKMAATLLDIEKRKG